MELFFDLDLIDKFLCGDVYFFVNINATEITFKA